MRHLKLPLALSPSGSLATLEQDSPAEIAQSVAVLLTTRPGEREAVPDYGSPDPTFGHHPAAGMADAIRVWEPRAASVDPTELAPTNAAEVLVRLGVTQ